MSKLIRTIVIEQEECQMCERFYYELNGWENLLIQFTSVTDFTPDEDRYKLILENYIEAYTAHAVFWSYLLNKYAKIEASENKSIRVNFDFNEIEILENDSCGGNGNGCCSTK